MRLVIILFALFLLLPLPTEAAQKRVTLYLDGARVEQDLPATDGYLEFPLPDSFLKGSLRVKPLGGNVQRVELLPAERDKRPAVELARLQEKREALLERIDALQAREEIFRTAAKSHTSRAPRKSKNNPDPMGSIRQGADYALAQLDQLRRAQSRSRSALKAVEDEIRALRKGEAVARVWLTGRKARISYLRGGTGWTPCYDFRFSAESAAELLLHARLPSREKGVQYLVSTGTMAAGPQPRPIDGEFPLIWRRPLTPERAAYREAPHPNLSLSFREQEGLPPGEAAGYWRGEYLGSVSFPGGSSGELFFGSKGDSAH